MEKPFVLLGDLSEVLGEPANTLGQMFKRGGFTLPNATLGAGTGNWTRFSMQDVAVLALIRALTNLGMQVRSASEAAQYVIEQSGAELDDLDQFVARWRDKRLVVSRTEKSWRFMIFKGPDEYSGGAYITVNVGRIVENAVARARTLAASRRKVARG